MTVLPCSPVSCFSALFVVLTIRNLAKAGKCCSHRSQGRFKSSCKARVDHSLGDVDELFFTSCGSGCREERKCERYLTGCDGGDRVIETSRNLWESRCLQPG